MKRVLVLDAHLTHALIIIQSLGKAGYAVVAASHRERPIGFASRYVRKRVRFNNIDQDVAAFRARLTAFVRAESVDLIIPVSDLTARPLVDLDDSFPSTAMVALPPRDSYLLCLDKLKCAGLAESVGLLAPRTILVPRGAALPKEIDGLQYPIVVKPRSSVTLGDNRLFFHSVSYATSPSSLAHTIKAHADAVDLLLQEFIPGTGVGIELLRSTSGHTIGCFQHQRLREMPITGGGSTCRLGMAPEQRLLAPSIELLQKCAWVGPAMVEFKVGPQGPVFMEINGRFWGSLALPVASGVDFPRLLANMHLGRQAERLTTARPYQSGRRAIKITTDIPWIWEVLRGEAVEHGIARREGLKALLSYLKLWNTSFDGICLDDVRPGMTMVADLCRRFLGKGG